jgi:hypothetical protein
MSDPRMGNSFAAQLADALETSWPAIARSNQLPPPGDWQVWLLLAGRGFGKTRTLVEWACHQAASGQAGRIALVAATVADARDVLVEGQSGILAVSPPWFRPVYDELLAREGQVTAPRNCCRPIRQPNIVSASLSLAKNYLSRIGAGRRFPKFFRRWEPH